jgi:hypothetical protein
VRTSIAYALVNLDATPLQRLDDILLSTWYKSLRVGILDTKNHLATMTARKKVVI